MNNESQHSETVGKLFESLAKAQGKIESALKDKKNPFFKSSYADLTSIWDACRSPLSENGLAIIQTVEGTKAEPFLVTWLGHASGEWIKSKLPLLVMKQDPQALGSAITYARRYALSAIVGVCSDDDDGEKAMARNAKPAKEIESDEMIIKIFDKFSKDYHEENPEYIIKYLKSYAKHYKKTAQETITEYQVREKFIEDYMKWKNKYYPDEVKS